MIISLTDVYYSGTEEQWNAIKIGEENTDLEKATIHFNSTALTEADSVNVTEETQDLTSHCIPTVCDVDYRINGDTAEAYGMVVIVDSPKDREELPKEIVVADTWRDAPVTAIAEEAFLDVDFAESIVLPDSVETIGVCAFLGCTSLQEIHLPKSLKTIDAAAFLDCQSLKTLYLYDNLESIGEGCFDDSNTSLTDIYYSGTEEQWNAIEIGEGNTALEKATIHFNADSADTATERFYYDDNNDNESLVSLNIAGDVTEDGTVDIVDVLALNQYLLGLADISDSGKISADVDSNNIINDTDSMNILKYLVNLIDSFDSLKTK